MAFTKKHPRVFTLIRPAATFSLREKESTGRWGVLSPARRDNRGRLGTAVPTPGLAKQRVGGAGASWSAAVPAAFRGRIRGCKNGNMDGQDFEELKTESLKLKTSKKRGAENRTPRRCRERCISLS